SCVSGAFGAVGQNCIGVQRIYVEKSAYNYFVDEFVAKTRDVKMGHKKDETTTMGPRIAEKEAIRVEELVNHAVEKDGVTIQTGGYRDGAFYAPTVLTEVPDDAEIAREEIFGPVVMIFPVADLDEAIDKSNS